MADVKVAAPVLRVMTTKRLRGLTPALAEAMLTDYLETGIGYRGLSAKYNVSQPLIVRFIQGSTYRDWNWPIIADLRLKAQAKAAARSALHSKALGVRVPAAALPYVSYNPRSVQSLDEAITQLATVRSSLLKEMQGA